MITTDPKLLLERLFNTNSRLTISREIHKAYRIVDEFCKSHCILNTKTMDEFRVRAINYLVESRLIKAANDHSLEEFHWEEEPNYQRNCHHLMLKNPNAILTVSQVTQEDEFPRDATFRTRHRYSNQLSLEGFNEEYEELPYIIITHGYKSDTPKFIRIGIPEPPPLRIWTTQIDLSYIKMEDEAYEIVEPKDIIKFRELENIINR